MKLFPSEMREAYLCQTLGLTEKELYETSEEWITYSLTYLDAQEKVRKLRKS